MLLHGFLNLGAADDWSALLSGQRIPVLLARQIGTELDQARVVFVLSARLPLERDVVFPQPVLQLLKLPPCSLTVGEVQQAVFVTGAQNAFL